MAFSSITVKPGLNTIATPALNQAGISASNLIRFRGGLVEKLGGWTNLLSGGMGSITRSLHAWTDLEGSDWLAVGSDDSFQATSNQAVTDITPQMITSNCPVNVSTSRGSKFVTIVDTNITNIQGHSSVFFSTPISVGGLILSGLAEIRPTPSLNTYSIEWFKPATNTAANAGRTPRLTTTQGTATVLVFFPKHGVVDGGTFVFPAPTLVGGLTISGVYKGCSKVDDDSFTFTAANQATSTQTRLMISNTNGAQLIYGVVNGPPLVLSAGAMGPLGEYAIGEGYAIRSTITNQTGTRISATDWTSDNWGEIILGCPEGGQIWYWSPTAGFASMLPVGNGPAFNTGIFVAMPAQILVAYGSTSSIKSGNTDSAQDKLIVRWSDQLDFSNWNVTSLTQAGSYHIPTGSEIRGGIQGAGAALIFTDVDVWQMNYIGYPDIFGFTNIYTSGGLVGKHAVCEMRGSIYWMGQGNFYVYTSGGVQVLPCPAWDNIFQDLDVSNAHKCVAAANSDFNEIWFFFPSASLGNGECDRYAKVNIAEGFEWDVGLMQRSAWVPRTPLGSPIGANWSNFKLYQHETGYSDDGAPMNSFFTTGYFPIGDAENFAFIDHLEPDMRFSTHNSSTPSAVVTLAITAVDYPTAPGGTKTETLTLTSTTQYLSPRIRGRQMQFQVSTNDADSFWRMGNIRYRYAIDGRR